MNKNVQLFLICAVVIVAALVFLSKFNIKCTTNTEGYINNTLSAIDRMKRTPVTYAFHGDGLSENPHYQAKPGDSRAPLEWQNFYDSDRESHILPPTTPFPLVNDQKLIQDMVESGDIFWHRVLNNMGSPAHKMVISDRKLEIDDAFFDPKPPLYSASYHYGDYIGE